MDTDDLHTLAAALKRRGFRVDSCEPLLSLYVRNPISERLLSDEITLTGDSYRMSSGYEIGERGQEENCAARIAYLLGATTTPREAAQ